MTSQANSHQLDSSGTDRASVPWQAVLFHDQKVRRAQVIIKEICELTGLTRNQLIGPSRLRRIVWPRRVAMWRMRTELDMTMESIGEVLNRDHTTVVTALQAVKHIHDKLKAQRGDSAHPDPYSALLMSGGKP